MNKKVLNRLLREEKGQVVVIFALLLTVLFGITSFATDIGYLQWQKRQLQNAADASALAGARELADGEAGSIHSVVIDYIAEYGFNENDITNNIEIQNISPEDSEVPVELRISRDLFFARVLGFQDSDVAARAVAAAYPLKKMGYLIPIGVPKSIYDEAAEGPIEVIRFQMTFGSGNWGWISFDGTGSDFNPNTIANYIEHGYPEPVAIEDPVQTSTGTSNPNMRSKIDAHIANETIVYVPIVEDGSGSGTTEFIIIGFAAIVLEERTGNPAHTTITARVIEGAFGSGVIDPGAPDFGLKGIALVE